MPLSHSTQLPLQDLDDEIVIDSLPMKGQLPPWLEGTLVRNGPAKFHFGNQTISHWFDGLAMLHAFTFGQGQVSYRNKFLRSEVYFQTTQKGDLKFMGFAQDPCKSIFQRLFAHFFPSLTPHFIQNANVNVMKIAEKYVALTETPLPVCFDPHTLETLGVLNFQDPLCKSDCFESAHPHHDRLRGETINYQTDLGLKCRYSFYTVSDQGPAKRKPFFEMKVDKASYMHTFALTENYVVMVEYPLVLNPLDLLMKGGGFITQFKWEPERNTRFHLIDRVKGLKIRSYDTDAFFSFHHVNAYEEKETIVLDLIKYPDAQIVFGYPPLEQIRTLERFRLDIKRPAISQKTISKTLLELPRIYYQKYNASAYQYVHGVGFKYPESAHDSIPILKINVSTGNVQEWKEPGGLAGEPIFIPRPEAREEDDGVILTVVTQECKNDSYLLVLDARDLKEIARSEAIHLIPYGLHGMFFHL